MKRFKQLFALVLAIMMLASMAACSKSGSSATQSGEDKTPVASSDDSSSVYFDKSGLPIIYLGGKAYPITIEDGILGLEQVNDGVLVATEEKTYDEARDLTIVDTVQVLYRSDGTIQRDYTGKNEFVLISEEPSIYQRQNIDPSIGIFYDLKIKTNGLPFLGSVGNSLSDFERVMEEEGYVPYQKENTYCRFYTEIGPIDAPSGKMSEAMGRLNDEIRGGKVQFGCTVRVEFHEDSGTTETSVILTAERDLVDLWYRQWAPDFKETIRPIRN